MRIKRTKVCMGTSGFIVITTVSILIWTQGHFPFNLHFPYWDDADLFNHSIAECSKSAGNMTYDDIATLFYTPNNTCASIGVGPLVRTATERPPAGYESGVTTPEKSEHQTVADSPLCQRYTKFSYGSHIYQLPSSQDVYELMKQCNKIAPRLVSFQNTTRKIKTFSNKTLPVPNIVHYVWFGGNEKFTFLCYLSFLSVHKYIEPDFIYIHGTSEPTGKWWKRTISDVANIYFVFKLGPVFIFGKKIKWIQHSADIARYDIIYDYGGIYLDTDVLVLKSFDPLRQFNLTLGRENPSALSNGIIVGSRGAPFFRLWKETYRTFDPNEWGDHSVIMADTLQKLFPALVHVEEGTLVSPTYRNHAQLFQFGYDWSRNYAVHVWKRHGYVPEDQKGMQQLNNTLGELMRYIYYGSKDIVSL